MNQQSKTIVITGASSGFGKAIATQFATPNYHLILLARRADRLAALADDLKNNCAGVSTYTLDVRNKEEVQKVFEQIAQQHKQIDLLINNAGLASGLSTIDEGDIDDWEIMIDTNLKGLLYVTRNALPLMPNHQAAQVINIGSTAGKLVYKNGNVYCATKFAVDALTQSMRIDLLERGIKVTAINPGMAATEFSLVRFKGDEDRAKKVYEGFLPLQAEDIAGIVWFVAQQPAHVCINDLTVTCTTQANGYYSIKK